VKRGRERDDQNQKRDRDQQAANVSAVPGTVLVLSLRGAAGEAL
jgi:hypothetical protein